MRRPLAPAVLALAITLLAHVAAGQAALHFGGPTFYGPFGLGWQLSTVATGDLTGDGRPDLAALAYYDLVVLPGHGGAEFGAPIDDGPTAQGGNKLVEGDLNADGRLDLVVSNTYGHALSVYLNQGGGVFGPPDVHLLAGLPAATAIGDLDGDGVPDLATANWTADTVSVLLGLGQGGFGPATDFPAGHTPSDIAIGDLDVDGIPDLVVANDATDKLSVLLGQGAGLFGPVTEYSIWSRSRALAIADLNGDGWPDLVAGNLDASSVAVLLNLGGGAFGPQASYATGAGPIDVAVGDLNGDGQLDVVSADLWAASLGALPGTGDGQLGPATACAVGGSPVSTALADFNADGTLDLAASHIGSNDACVLLNQGADGNPWSVYGFGLAGTGGIPDLSATGPQDPGGATLVTLSNAYPDAPANLYVSVANKPTAFKGGLLVPVPVGVTLNVVTDGLGSVQLVWPNWPAGIPAGTAFYVQFAVLDPAAVRGVALSGALQALAP